MNYETYASDLQRRWNQDMNNRPEEWVVSESLSAKITQEGQMNDFYGATSVITLSESDRQKCRVAQERLLGVLEHQLVKLEPETFHLTIHSFSNVNNTPGGKQVIQEKLAQLEEVIAAEFRSIAALYGGQRIRMRSLGVSTSGKDVISIKYVPASKDDYEILTDLYNRMEKIFPEYRSYVPHVSLGYFKLKKLEQAEIALLYDTLERMCKELDLDIVLDVDRFVYQHHFHMNDFRDVFSIQEYK
ncbi:hypothetical protein PUW24_07055 [Paenibacillus urinalis]|uniref:2'-5' RNA ligase family protein n=1 Tax=Paenibacillus urinalis TaxID=521520 RepID=A0ABY7XCP7_9BACL|nr:MULTISPECIES: hypothetical protein [Paenibacillus]WDH98673.1 hypothetical protein PUW24_07055 [Paenibacillus urinalis]WDI02367.1 hypothetical protein PUW25_24780 [Paenibacillus urinalis]GAK41552.1 hypothetical protein TCA2_4043 [Paenibacillus sp. TCA20]